MPGKKVKIDFKSEAKPAAKSDTNSDTKSDKWVIPEVTMTLASEMPVIKMKRLTLDIPESLHRSIKIKAVERGVPMVDMLRELLEKHYGK